MLNIGPQELLLVLLIALIVVGPQRLPELSRQIGKGLRELRKVQDEVKGMVKLDLDDKPAQAKRSPTTATAPAVHRTPRPAPQEIEPTAAAAEAPAGEATPPDEPSSATAPGAGADG